MVSNGKHLHVVNDDVETLGKEVSSPSYDVHDNVEKDTNEVPKGPK